MAYIKCFKFVASSNKFEENDGDFLEIKGDFVEYIGTLPYSSAKIYMEETFKSAGFECEVEKAIFKKIQVQGQRIKKSLKGVNSKKRYDIRGRWHRYCLKTQFKHITSKPVSEDYIFFSKKLLLKMQV